MVNFRRKNNILGKNLNMTMKTEDAKLKRGLTTPFLERLKSRSKNRTVNHRQTYWGTAETNKKPLSLEASRTSIDHPIQRLNAKNEASSTTGLHEENSTVSWRVIKPKLIY